MRLFALLAGLVVSAGALAGDALMNRSFEDIGDSSTQSAHWSKWGEVHRDEEGPTNGGRFSLHCPHQDDTSGDMGFYQDVQAQRGASYTFRIYAHVQREADGYPPDRIDVYMESHDEGKLSVLEMKSYTPADMENGQWTRLSVSGRALSGGLRVVVRVIPSKCKPRTGSVRFDEASLLVSAPAEPREPSANE